MRPPQPLFSLNKRDRQLQCHCRVALCGLRMKLNHISNGTAATILADAAVTPPSPKWPWEIVGNPLIVVIYCLSNAEECDKNSQLRPCFTEFLSELLYSV